MARSLATTAAPAAPHHRLPRWARLLLVHRRFMIGGAVLLVEVVIIALAPVLAPSDPLAINPADRLASPSPAHWFGTDHLGRDVLSRILYGASYSRASRADPPSFCGGCPEVPHASVG